MVGTEFANHSEIDVLEPAHKTELPAYQPYLYKDVGLVDFQLHSFRNMGEAREYFNMIMNTLRKPNTLKDMPDRDIYDLRDTVRKVIAYDKKYNSHRGTEELISLGLISPDDPDLPWIEGEVTVKKIPESTQ